MAKYRKPTIQQSIAPNAALIQGEAMLRASEATNPVQTMNLVTTSINKFMAPQMKAAAAKKNASDAKWNSWLKSLGPNVDLEGLNPQQTEVIGAAARNLKNEYLQTYQTLNGISDKQSQEYMDAVGQMNNIMAKFKGLSTFKNGHIEKQQAFDENKKNGNYSNQSQNDGSYDTAVEIYGAGIDGTGSQWVLGDDGSTIMYNTSNGAISPADVPETTLIDYKSAGDISQMLTTIDEAGVGLTPPKESALRSKLETMLGSNPAALNSIIYDNKIPNVTFDIPEEILNGDPSILRETVINQIVASSATSAANEKARKEKKSKKSRSGGGGGGSAYYAPEFTGKVDEKGNKIYNRFPKDPNGKPIVFTMEDVEASNTTATEEGPEGDTNNDGIPDILQPYGPQNQPNVSSSEPAEESEVNMKIVKGMMEQCGVDEATAIARVKNKQYTCP
mgnify:CR=1 FL=1|tara:strand:+ start:3694 stop:5031 length:1338 start_codon:yes stop_codon:yes gene_type:complete